MTEKPKPIDPIDVTLYVYCLLLFCYVAYRAFSLSFTFDEITTSQIVNGDEWSDFGLAANNHFLNVILIKASLFFFKPSELVYRLPNVLGFVLYLVYAVKLGRLLKPSAPYIPLLLLTAMPFILDFFGLSRGYGLSLSFVLPSIYFLLKYCEENTIQLGLLSMGSGMLAVMSNFTALNYFLPSLLILFAYTLFSAKRIASLRILIYSVITGVFFYFIIPVILELKNQGELYFGGRTSFYNDTLLSLSRTFAYHYLSIPLANIVFSTLFFLALLFSIINIFRAIQQKSFSIRIVLPILFLLSILSPVMQHLFLETSFPTERTALLYYPILILVVLNGADGASAWIEKRLLELLAFSFLIHLFLTANTTHCYSWRFDSGSKEVIGLLKEEYDQKENNEPVSLGIDYLNIQSISFYKSAASFIDLSHHEVVKCWEYDMQLEELDPMYYGTTIVRKDRLSPEDAERIVSTEFDHYYLNDFVVKELIRHGYSITVEKHFPIPNTSLIKLN